MCRHKPQIVERESQQMACQLCGRASQMCPCLILSQAGFAGSFGGNQGQRDRSRTTYHHLHSEEEGCRPPVLASASGGLQGDLSPFFSHEKHNLALVLMPRIDPVGLDQCILFRFRRCSKSTGIRSVRLAQNSRAAPLSAGKRSETRPTLSKTGQKNVFCVPKKHPEIDCKTAKKVRNRPIHRKKMALVWIPGTFVLCFRNSQIMCELFSLLSHPAINLRK